MYTVHARSLNDIHFVHLSLISLPKAFFKLINTQKRQPENEKMGGGLRKGYPCACVRSSYLNTFATQAHLFFSSFLQ